MKELKIEKNVPLTVAKYVSYPFKDMDVGDSFKVDSIESLGKARAAASHYGCRNGKKFITRKSEDGGRVWRIE